MVLSSKELLSAVLGEEVVGLNFVDNRIEYVLDSLPSTTRHINIYELMNIMKDFIGKRYSCFGTTKSSSVIGWFLWIDEEDIRFIAETEHEAVTKACEWILEQQK